MTSDAPDTATILVVDDEPSLLRLVTRVLERAGHVVLAASDGDQALELISEHEAELDAVILDVIIPPDGIGVVLERVVAVRPDLAVVLSSGDLLSDELREQLRSCNGVFLRKPFLPKGLLRVVQELLPSGRATSDDRSGPPHAPQGESSF